MPEFYAYTGLVATIELLLRRSVQLLFIIEQVRRSLPRHWACRSGRVALLYCNNSIQQLRKFI